MDYLKEVKKLTEGKNLKYIVETFGCSQNESDSEKISGLIEQMGFIRTDDLNEASFIVFNTCCVRENAEERLFGKLGEIKALKAKRDVIVAIGGCMMQEKSVLEKLEKSYKYVDIVFGTHTMQDLIEDVYKVLVKHKKVTDIKDIDGEIIEGLPVKREDSYKAQVTIMYGCNNFCTYCIVPYVRGRERSRAPQDILYEINELAHDGYKEVMLLGQNVNSYGNDNFKYCKKDIDATVNSFSKLLRAVNDIDGIERIRFLSPHPKDFSQDVIETIRDSKKISRLVHLPLQSGSTKVLKEMNRNYTKDDYLNLVSKMREMIPNVSFSTDIIVGFPGETEEDFLDTLDVVEKVGFEQVFMFIYSPRKGTKAYNRTDTVDDKVIHDRFNRLKDLSDKIVDSINEKYVGTVQKVLVEGYSKNNSKMLTGRTDTNKVTVFKPIKDVKIGDIKDIKIIKNHKWYLEGEIL